ncbi:hypothetical protein SBA2_450074 [Acidobacteriia bacterium SbA2]|nr:hypothetical protein SBA2_450074 [Acidobacteriia bacterium SbA2]
MWPCATNELSSFSEPGLLELRIWIIGAVVGAALLASLGQPPGMPPHLFELRAAGLLSQKFVEEFSPRSEPQSVAPAQAAEAATSRREGYESRGAAAEDSPRRKPWVPCATPPPALSPAGRGKGEERGVGARSSQGLRPGLLSFAPTGAAGTWIANHGDGIPAMVRRFRG